MKPSSIYPALGSARTLVFAPRRYGISRAQLHAALSYFYDHREAIREYEAETERLMKEHGSSSRAKLEELHKRQHPPTE